MKKLIAITTDFGDEFAVAQLHAILAAQQYEGKVIENHSVTPFSIVEGAFQIQSLSKFTPSGTIHLGVVDPGVGSKRAGIIIKNHSSWFIGPDNGLLYPAAKAAGIDQVWRIKESKISDNFSNTFHGRDVFIKAAIFISKGKNPEHFGSEKINPDKISKLTIRNGQILHIDAFGNIKVFWEKQIVIGQVFKIKIKNKKINFPIVKTFSDVKKGKPLAYRGSNDTLELAINLGNAAKKFGLKTGQTLNIIEI